MLTKVLKWWFKGYSLRTEVKTAAKTLGNAHWADLTQHPDKLGTAALKIFNHLYVNSVNDKGYWAEAKRKAIKSTLKEVAEKETASKIISLVMSARNNGNKFTKLNPSEREAITSHKEALKELISAAFSRGSIQIIKIDPNEQTLYFTPSREASKEIIRNPHYKKLAIEAELDEDLFNAYIQNVAELQGYGQNAEEQIRNESIERALTLQNQIAEFNKKENLESLSKQIESNIENRFKDPIKMLDHSVANIAGKGIPSVIHRDAQGQLPVIKYEGESHITPSLNGFFYISGEKNTDKFSSYNLEARDITLSDVYKKILSPLIELHEEIKKKTIEHNHNEAWWKILTFFVSQEAIIIMSTPIVISLMQTHNLVGAGAILNNRITNESKVASYHLDGENLNISLSYRLFLGENNSLYPLMHYTEVKANFAFNLTTLKPTVNIEPFSLYPALTAETINEATQRAPSFSNADQLLEYVNTARLPKKNENEI